MRVVFTRSNSLACKLIRAIDGGEWSHCAIVLDAGLYGLDRCVEAVYPGGVRMRSLNGLMAARPEHMVLELEVPEPRLAQALLVREVGKAYDWAALPSLAIRAVFGAAPNLASGKRWYCSELVLAACATAGAPIKGPLRRYGVQAAFDHCWTLQKQ